MKRLYLLRKTIQIAAIIWVAAAVGCTRDNTDYISDVPVPGRFVTIEMSVAGFDTPVTRSIDGASGEAAVQSVDVLVFDKPVSENTSPNLLAHYTAENIIQSTQPPDYKFSFEVELQTMSNAGTVVLVANASSEVQNALDNAASQSKTDILAALKFNTPEDDGKYNWKVEPDNYTPVPMYGEKAVDGITEGMTLTVFQMTRMLARIDVENKVKGNIFKLEEIYLVNYHAGGYIAPHWNRVNGNVPQRGDAGYIYTNNIDPVIPDDAHKPANTQQEAMMYEYKQENYYAGPLMAGEIYAYEEVKSDPAGMPPADPAGRICLILKGIYEGAEYYYRVDFTSNKKIDGQDVEIGDPIPLYRSHKYVVTITAAEGIGYTTFDEALNSSTVLSNLKTSILVVDMEGINNIVFDGQYFMGVESRSVDLPWGMGRHFNHKVASDYHGSWRAHVLDSTVNTWLQLKEDVYSVSGMDINRTGLDIILTEAPLGAEGKVVFTAGRLRDTLTVNRIPIVALFARSNVVQQESGASARLTFAVTKGDNTAIPAYSEGMFFKWGSLFAVSPPGNPYDPAEHITFNPTNLDPSEWGGGLAGWDLIPYAHSNFGFPDIQFAGDGSDDHIDAFAEYKDGTGFSESEGVGDVCRYISNKSWVKGKWRMPTYAEMEMLYEETADKEVHKGNFTDVTAILNAGTDQYKYGNFNPQSGWFLGVDVTSAVLSVENSTGTPPDGTAYFPATGQRYPDGNGNVVQVGSYGYHWSATPYDNITVNYLFFGKYFDEVTFYDADRSYAFPVRCIRDY